MFEMGVDGGSAQKYENSFKHEKDVKNEKCKK
jgi:hypothetical protein